MLAGGGRRTVHFSSMKREENGFGCGLLQRVHTGGGLKVKHVKISKRGGRNEESSFQVNCKEGEKTNCLKEKAKRGAKDKDPEGPARSVVGRCYSGAPKKRNQKL